MKVLARKITVLLGGMMLLAAPAFAHAGHHGETGLTLGMMHPFSGLGHMVVAMIFGVLAGMLPRASAWLVGFGAVICMAIAAPHIALHGVLFGAGVLLSTLILIAAGALLGKHTYRLLQLVR